jgi:hypothetical protein
VLDAVAPGQLAIGRNAKVSGVEFGFALHQGEDALPIFLAAIPTCVMARSDQVKDK